MHKIKFGTLWGFDSFAGLPSIRAHEAGYQDQGDLRAGQFNALRYLRRDFAQFEAELQSLVKYDRMRLVRGFYNESLPALSASTIAQMQPAVLIDFDGDFYESTIGPYEFLWRHCLVAPTRARGAVRAQRTLPIPGMRRSSASHWSGAKVTVGA